MIPQYDRDALEQAWSSMQGAGDPGAPNDPRAALGGDDDRPSGAPPHYRCPTDMPGKMCGNCNHRNISGICTLHEFPCDAGCVCNDWQGRPQGQPTPEDPNDPPPPMTVLHHELPPNADYQDLRGDY